MSKRASIESKVITFFETASIEVAQMILGIVKERVRARTLASQPASAPRVTRAKRAKKVNTGTQTSFEPATLAQ